MPDEKAAQATETPAPAAPAAPAVPKSATQGLPEGYVAISKAEHDALAADVRRLRKAQADAEKAEQDRKTAEERKRQADAGQFEAALAAADAEKAALQARVEDLARRDALRGEIAKRGLTGERAALAASVANLSSIAVDAVGNADAITVTAALDSVLASYPSLAAPAAPAPAAGSPAPAPATPSPGPAAAATADVSQVPGGYVSPEAYAATPYNIRITPEFQQRVKLSRPSWNLGDVRPADFAPR